jgi:argininosuccinate lyase
VTYAKTNNIKPLDFPYEQARRIYADAMKDSKYGADLPMSEAEFRSTLDPVAIVKNRATVGGPQPAEMDRMIKEAREQLASQDAWIKARRAHIQDSLAELDKQFDALVASASKAKAQ